MGTDYLERKVKKSGLLSRVLENAYPEFPYMFLMSLLRKRDVFINQRRATPRSTVQAGDVLSLFLRPQAAPVETLYIDDNLLAVYKPKSVVSDGEYSFSSLVRFVYPTALLLHRLDTNTDGVLLFALNDRAYDILKNAMKAGEIIKEYRARVYGEVSWKDKKLSGYLLKNPKEGKVKIYDNPVEGAEKVELVATTLSIKEGTTLLKVVIHGGKTHQIRAQLAYAGYFILGDGKYGDDRINRLYEKRSQELTALSVTFQMKEDILGLNSRIIAKQ